MVPDLCGDAGCRPSILHGPIQAMELWQWSGTARVILRPMGNDPDRHRDAYALDFQRLISRGYNLLLPGSAIPLRTSRSHPAFSPCLDGTQLRGGLPRLLAESQVRYYREYHPCV